MRCFIFALTIPALISCANQNPPQNPPTNFDAPPALSGKGYATHIARATFPFDVKDTRAFLDDGARLLSAMEDTDKIAAPVDFVMLQGDVWPASDAVRRLKFSDGHYALERVIEYSPERFTYQVWDFTSVTGNNVAYIYGVQEIKQNSDNQSEFIWSYNVKPNASWKKPFVRRFVDNEISEFIDIATSKTEAAAVQMEP